jgi:hypothetical protein
MSEWQKLLDIERNISRPSERVKAIVNELRHTRMAVIAFDSKDNAAYMRVYTDVMNSIKKDYPFLSQEVKRQIDKKTRWQTRRSSQNEKAGPKTRASGVSL